MKAWQLKIGNIEKFDTTNSNNSELLVFEPKEPHPTLTKIGLRKETITTFSKDPITKEEKMVTPPRLVSYFYFSCAEKVKQTMSATSPIPLAEWPHGEGKPSENNPVFEPTGTPFFGLADTKKWYKGELDKFFKFLSIDEEMISFLNKHLLNQSPKETSEKASEPMILSGGYNTKTTIKENQMEIEAKKTEMKPV